MEDRDLLLVDLKNWSIGVGDDIVGQDLMSRGCGGGVGRDVVIAG